MYRTTIGFHARMQRGEIPVLHVIIHTDLGYRAYAAKELSVTSDIDAGVLDGSWLLDGTVLLSGGLGFLEKSARVFSVGGLDRTISPQKQGLLLSYTQKQQQNVNISFINNDRYFSKLIAKEPFLTKALFIYLCFEGLPFSEGLKLFSGSIENLTITDDKLNLEAVEV